MALLQQWRENHPMLGIGVVGLTAGIAGIGAFANSFQALTLSVSFEVYRDATDTKIVAGDYYTVDTDAHETPLFDGNVKGKDRPRGVVGRLICMEPELVSISEGAVSVEQVKLSQQEIHNQLLGGAPEVEDANQLDTLAR